MDCNNQLAIKDDHMRANGYIFVHIPKTAGRSLLNALGVKFHCQHLRLAQYEQQLGAEEMSKRFKFSAVRNPWDRAVSWYRFFQFKPHLPQQEQSFDEWVQKATRNPRSPLDQFGWLRDSSGSVKMDQLLQFEFLDRDYSELRLKLSFLPEKLSHIGRNDHLGMKKLPYQEWYKSQQSIDAVAGVNTELIQRFGYKF